MTARDAMPDSHDTSLYRLLYVSTARHFLSNAELTALLQQARRNNRAHGITGMLIYVEGSFLQYVEGPQKEVEALIARLERDNRHHGLIRLTEGWTGQRIFSDWSMGYCSLHKHAHHAVRGAVDLARQPLRSGLPAGTPADLVMFMESFYRSSLGLRDHETFCLT